jgi:hypothetical protein
LRALTPIVALSDNTEFKTKWKEKNFATNIINSRDPISLKIGKRLYNTAML